jgi:hypothetical protein
MVVYVDVLGTVVDASVLGDIEGAGVVTPDGRGDVAVGGDVIVTQEFHEHPEGPEMVFGGHRGSYILCFCR